MDWIKKWELEMLKVAKKAIWIGAALAAGLALTVGSRAQAGDLDINGVYYQKIVYMKDLVADILPPPAYIIESYLTVLQIVAEADKGPKADKSKIDSLIEYGRKLKDGKSDKGESAGYLERIDFWKKDLKDTPDLKELKVLITKKSVEPALKFYEIRDKKFVPAIRAGKVDEAKKIVRQELKPLYEGHRTVIDVLVQEATKVSQMSEKAATERLAKGETGGDLIIKGPLYSNIIQMKDLIADILPPPRYIIEALLVVHQMIDEVEGNGNKPNDAFRMLAAYGNLLRAGDSSKGEISGYLERRAYWAKNLSEKTLPEKKVKELMIKSSDEPAMKFFEIRDAKLVKVLEAGKVDEAKKIVNDELTPLYETHRKFIDDLVARADKQYKQLETEVAGQLGKK